MPNLTIQAAFELALQHHQLGQFREAEAIYRQILSVQPNHTPSLSNLGEVCRLTGRVDDAIMAFRRAVELKPDFLEAHNNLGIALAVLGQLDEAAVEFRRALAIKPDYAEANNNLGNVLHEQGHLEEALAAFRRTLEIRPNYADPYNNLGNVLKDQGHFEEALASLYRALEFKPDYPDAHNNVAASLTELGRLDEALVAVRRAIHLQANHGNARFNYAFILLLSGDLAEGWLWYESRWDAFRTPQPVFAQPKWVGGPVEGKRVLLYAEQGFGDSIQFIRYAKLIAERGGKVSVVCPPALVEFFQSSKDIDEVVASGGTPLPFDFHAALLSLPLAFETTAANIPAPVSYLFPDPKRHEAWQERLGTDRKRLRVGLAWAGDSIHRRNRIRNIAPELLAPVLAVDGVDFYSLQLGEPAAKISDVPGASALIDHTAHLQNFADTAAFMAELDLIISVDTAIIHLAGSLGRPVWTLLSFIPDWRWGLKGEQTPWYPTMRLFRQPAVNDWESVILNVVAELARLAESKKA